MMDIMVHLHEAKIILSGSGSSSLNGHVRHELRLRRVCLLSMKKPILDTAVTSVAFIPFFFPNLTTLPLETGRRCERRRPCSKSRSRLALIPIFARLRYLENLVLIPKQLVGVSNGDNLTELAFELVLMIGVLCYPLHEEPKKNALDFFRQCSKLVEVTLVREQDSHRFTLTKEDRMNNDLDAFVTDSYDPKDNGRYGY
ncbi:F-box domain-containing protein [Colletotrichum tofieldiae]|nr:F-box domain-containing protein [Colletotrichum tofieldiae]